jgi:hypothetical protein
MVSSRFGGQFAQRTVERGHGLGRECEPGIGIADDGADGHMSGSIGADGVAVKAAS